MHKRILFTGGGSAGHVTPNLALIKKFQQSQVESYCEPLASPSHESLTPPSPESFAPSFCSLLVSSSRGANKSQGNEDTNKPSDDGTNKPCDDGTKKLHNVSWEIFYIGSRHGIERELVAKTSVPYYPIFTGKLRRYFCLQNFIDPFKILTGIWQAFFLCKKIKPDVIFSKGGFVAFPVVFAAWLNRIPIIAHEADLTIGLANKLCLPFADKICLSFPDSKIPPKYRNKTIISGLPIREEFFHGDKEKGRTICQFTSDKNILLIFGGSLGADTINKVIRATLPELLTKYQIAHVCGAGKIDASINSSGYKQFAYLQEEFPHVIAAADIVISRAGANSIYEIISLRKPSILIPLSKTSSRGDQIANAKYVTNKNLCQVIFEEDLNIQTLLQKIEWLENNREFLIKNLQQFPIPNSVNIIYDLATTFVNQNKTRR